jgi:hypothetical protein
MPNGHPNLKSRLQFSHNQEGDHKVRDGHVVALDLKILQTMYIAI